MTDEVYVAEYFDIRQAYWSETTVTQYAGWWLHISMEKVLYHYAWRHGYGEYANAHSQ